MSAENLPKMQYRFLGRSGLQVSVISLGGWLTYGGHVDDGLLWSQMLETWPVNEFPEKSFECLKAAYDAGINFFDCAEAYSSGESEVVIGKAIKHFKWKRNDLVISTKIYWGGAYGDIEVNNKGLSRKHIVEGTNAALERLGLEYVDLIYAHRPDRNTPMEETVRAFNHIIDQGKAFYWGTSEWNADEISEAWRVAERYGLIGPLMEQPQYNLLARDKVEKEFAGVIERHGLGLTIFSPLKMGVLTGKYNEEVPEDSRLAQSKDPFSSGRKKAYGDDDWKQQIAHVKNLKPIADKLGCDQAALAMAWVIKNPDVSSAITGASRVEQVHNSIRSLDIVPKLTDEVMKEIDDVLGNKPALPPRRF